MPSRASEDVHANADFGFAEELWPKLWDIIMPADEEANCMIE
jgi:hypothetical protein